MPTKEDIESLIKSGIRSIAAFAPPTACISQAWNEYESKKQSQRIEELFDLLKTEIKRVEERIQSVQDHIIKSGEIPTIIENTVDKIRREASKEKRGRYARLVANLIASGSNLLYDEKLSYIETLDFLTDQDLHILAHFAPDQHILVDHFIKNRILKDTTQEGIGRLVSSLAKLESRGLIGETSPVEGASLAYFGDDNSWDNRWRKKHFELLPQGRKFCQMVFKDGI